MLRPLAFTFLLFVLVWPDGTAPSGWAQSVGTRPQFLPTSPLVIETDNGRHEFEVEVAATRRERATGLMYRQDMADNHGMLFDYPTPQTVSMWMKNTYIPLDMLFIRANGRIANIVEDTEPRSLDSVHSRGRVMAVLELNAGTVDKLGISPGHLVRHRIFGNMDTTAAAE